MTINEYIQKYLSGVDSLPFETVSKIFKKNSIVTSVGDIENNIYFLQDGIVEVGMEKKDELRIIDFFFANQFFSSYTSFLTQSKSDVYLKCLTDCTIELIPHKHLIPAYRSSLVANQLGRHITEVVYMQRVKKEKDFLTKSAEQRYLDLIIQRPEIVKFIPIVKIAKYLGIHPESLSRLRRGIS